MPFILFSYCIYYILYTYTFKSQRKTTNIVDNIQQFCYHDKYSHVFCILFKMYLHFTFELTLFSRREAFLKNVNQYNTPAKPQIFSILHISV